MKKFLVFLLIIALISLCGCNENTTSCDIIATTLPVYDFTSAICDGTKLQIERLVTEDVACLHDYTLQVDQMRMIEDADVVVISGAGLEAFLDDALQSSHTIIDASINTHAHAGSHTHNHGDHDAHGHNEEVDPHIWLSPENARIMAYNIAESLIAHYPKYQEVFQQNLEKLVMKLDTLQEYGTSQLADLKHRDMITFHDGFAYFAESFDLHILEAIEEESGSEASAAEIIHLVELVNGHNLPAVFTERSGSDACAGIICKETGAEIYTLDMAMAGDSYFDALYHNIDTVKEALG